MAFVPERIQIVHRFLEKVGLILDIQELQNVLEIIFVDKFGPTRNHLERIIIPFREITVVQFCCEIAECRSETLLVELLAEVSIESFLVCGLHFPVLNPAKSLHAVTAFV